MYRVDFSFVPAAPIECASFADALEAGRRAHFSFTVTTNGRLLAAWCPLYGLTHYPDPRSTPSPEESSS